MSEKARVSIAGATIILILGTLSSFGPMSMDMYLPALPTIEKDFLTTASNAQLTLSSFTIGFAIGPLFYGPLSDRFGRRPVLLFGIIFYVVAGILCAITESIDALITLRFFQAIGGAAGLVLTRAIVRDLWSGTESARILSLSLLIVSFSALIAPFIGGYLLKFLGWRLIFWLLGGYGVLTLALAWFALPETLPKERRQATSFGQIIPQYLLVFRNRQAMGYMLCGGFSFAGMFAQLSGTPFVYIEVFGVAPEHYGLIFGVNIIAIMLGSWLNSQLVGKFGVRPMLRLGLGFAFAGGVFLAFFSWFEIGGLFGIAIPIALYMFPHNLVNANAASASLEYFPEVAGTASAVLGLIRFGTGASVGALVGLLYDGTALPMAIVIAGCGLGAILTYLLMTRDLRAF